MGKQYYKIISTTPRGIAKILKRNIKHTPDGKIDSINYETPESFNNNDLYTGYLSESLETKEMERYIALCKKNNKQPSINSLFPNGFAFEGNSKNFLGYTTALIELKFTSKYEKRELYYEKGFYFKEVKYVRYKRSASSARNGKCLFIMEDLLKKHMEKWSNCGINPELIDDLTSWEAYKGLTLSSIESTITLPYDSILIIKDQESCFNDYVATPFDETNNRQTVEIKNIIWDGEGLLDDSVFINPNNKADYSSPDCSMLFLRSRFFKTCGFRTNLQLWFEDNHIDNISQLNGFTLAKHPKDIKLVITESSLKYSKFVNTSNNENSLDLEASLKQWITGQGINIHANYKEKLPVITFGVVKTNHPTKYYSGKLVQTNYQFLNTLPLSKNDVKELLRPAFEYINLAKNSPTFFREFINIGSSSKDNKNDNASGYRQYFINELVQLTNTFSGTKMYTDFRKKTLNDYRHKIRNGKILVEGTLATLFGNPAEFLYATLKNNSTHQLGDPLRYMVNNIEATTPVLHGNEIFCKHFEDNAVLTCARNPHVTMGNLFVAQNKYIPFYERYFRLSDEIVCVNAIKYNLQHKLNGADYDSDAMLITNNPIIVSAAQRSDGIFPVPFNSLSTEKRKLDQTRTISSQLSELDSLISDDLTGQIINLSQEMNSYIWSSIPDTAISEDRIDLDSAREFLSGDYEGKYDEACLLAILSNIALDKAKRNYKENISDKLFSLQQSEVLYRTRHINGHLFIQERPLFLQKLLGIRPSDYNAEVTKLYRILGKSQKEFIVSKPKKTNAEAYIKNIFGDDIDVYKYEVTYPNDTNFTPDVVYRISAKQSLNCTMSYIFDILEDKEQENNINLKIKERLKALEVTVNSSSIKLADLIEKPKAYKPALEYVQKIKEIVKQAYNKQRKVANRKDLDEKEKHMLRGEIIDQCFKNVDELLRKYYKHVKYIIYILLNDIDNENLLTQEDKDDLLVSYPSLLFSCICNHTRDNEHIFYNMVELKASNSGNKPSEMLIEDKHGDVHLFTIPHSIKHI